MTVKIKRPYEIALHAALDLLDLLRPACERIEIAGSVRRECREVGDLELVAIPRRTVNLLGEPDGSELDGVLYSWNFTLSKNGPKYKQFTYDGMQVDLFLAMPDNYGYILMIRTGPADFSRKMVTPRPYGLKPPTVNVRDGYVYSVPLNNKLSVPSEQALFDLWGLDYLPPQARR
jgi:DNA polymerase/3'-5' exonuclease PolX